MVAITNIAAQLETTFMDYFPDENFAQGVAEHLLKNKEDFQNGLLPWLYLSDTDPITYEQLTSLFILQTKANNNNILSGKWWIRYPSLKAVNIPGGDGSEINSSLFDEVGTYNIYFYL